MKISDQKEKILNKIKDQSKLIFCDDFEIVIQENYTKGIVYRNQKKIYQKSFEEVWVGLRILQRKQLGQAYGVISNDADISELVEKAILSSSHSQADPWFHFPVWRPWHNQIDQLKKNTINTLSEDIEPTSQGSVYSLEESIQSELLTSLIFRKSEKKSIFLESKDIDRNFMIYNEGGFFLKDKGVSQEFLQEKFKMLECAEDFSQQEIKNLLLSPQVLTKLLRFIVPIFDLKEKMEPPLLKGEKIFSECINLVASGTSPLSEMQKYFFDIEGVPIKKNTLVSRGILSNYFFDTYLASKENAMSSGNRVRYVGEPKPTLGAYYNYLEPNPHQSEKEICSEIESGAVVEFLEKIQIEPSQEVMKAKVFILGHGYEVLKSKKAPRRNIFIQCSIFDLLNNAVQLTNNIKFYGRIGSPWGLFKINPQK